MVSVIVLTYNRPEYLKETLKSILKQTYSNFEILVIDDGSDADNAAIVGNFNDNRIKYFKFLRQKNLSKLRNEAIRLSVFRYIAFCDDDDLWVENKLEKQMEKISCHNFICTNAEIINSKGEVEKKRYYDQFNTDFEITNEYLVTKGNIILISSILFDKNLIFENNIFWDEQRFTTYCEDYNVYLYLSEKTNILFLNEPLTKIRFHESMSGGLDNNIQMLKTCIALLKNYQNQDHVPSLMKKKTTQGIIEFKVSLVKKSFKKGLNEGVTEFFSLLIYLLSPQEMSTFLSKKLLPALKKKISKVDN